MNPFAYLLTSSRAKWLIVPAMIAALWFVPPSWALASGAVFAGATVLTFVEQGGRLKLIPRWLVWVSRALDAVGFVFLARWVGPVTDEPLVNVSALCLSAGTGFLLGHLAANTWGHQRHPKTAAGLRPVKEGPGVKGFIDFVSDMSRPDPQRLTGLDSNADPSHDASPAAGDAETRVEVRVGDCWYPGVLHSWATRDLGILGRVTYAIDGIEVEAWVPGDELRRTTGRSTRPVVHGLGNLRSRRCDAAGLCDAAGRG